MQKFIVLLMLVLGFTTCEKIGFTEKAEIKKANWLIGKWINQSSEGILSETWQKVNDSMFTATSNFIKEKDTLHFETITLSENNKTLTYLTTIIGQNNDNPIAFKLIKSSENQLVFENPKHDYPQKISYTKINSNSLIAEISGIQKGVPSVEKYPMRRKK